jgi:hypothetical protein
VETETEIEGVVGAAATFGTLPLLASIMICVVRGERLPPAPHITLNANTSTASQPPLQEGTERGNAKTWMIPNTGSAKVNKEHECREKKESGIKGRAGVG